MILYKLQGLFAVFSRLYAEAGEFDRGAQCITQGQIIFNNQHGGLTHYTYLKLALSAFCCLFNISLGSCCCTSSNGNRMTNRAPF